MTGRYIAVDVGIFEHPVLAGERFTRHVAWLWLIANAAWKERRVRIGEALITLQRGQVIIGRAYLANRWGWTEKQVRRFLDVLAAEGMIEKGRSQGRVANIATICNYDKYQSNGTIEGPVGGPVEGRFGAGSGPHSTKDTKETNSNPPYPPEGAKGSEQAFEKSQPQRPANASRQARKAQPSDEGGFDRFWQAYPRHVEKAAAWKAFLKLTPKQQAHAIAAAPAYAAQKRHEKAEPRYIKHAATWLHTEGFEDFPSSPASTDTGDAASEFTADQMRSLAHRYLTADSWDRDLGPPPGASGSIVSAELLASVKASLSPNSQAAPSRSARVVPFEAPNAKARA